MLDSVPFMCLPKVSKVPAHALSPEKAYILKEKWNRNDFFLILVAEKVDLYNDGVQAESAYWQKKGPYTSYTPDYFSGKRNDSSPEK